MSGIKKALREVLAVAAIATAGCDPNHGSTKPPRPASSDTRFENSCRLKGGTPVITRKGGQSQYNCVPPVGGWS